MKTVSDDRLKCWACGQIHLGAHLVTLHDGRQVGSYSEDWRLECEAKAVTRLPTLERRRKYLEAVKEKRGVKAWNELQDRILSLWKTSKPNAQPQVAQNSGGAGADTPAESQH